MVYRDIYNPNTLNLNHKLHERHHFKAWRIPLADPLNRWAALVVDLGVILAPLISLFLSSIKKQVLISDWLGKKLDFQVYVLIYLIGVNLIVILYQGLFTAYFGGTPGKLFFGLRVVSIWNDEKPSLGASLLRAIYWCLGAGALFLPHLAIFYHRERRPIYDRLADTVVVAQEKYAVGPPEASLSSFLRLTLTLIYLTTLTTGARFLYSLFKENRHNPKASLFSTTNNDETCPLGSDKLQRLWNPVTRVERALSLFLINKINEECLDQEADNALWNASDVIPAYAAKAILFMDEKSIFTKYLLKTCHEKKENDYCLLVKALRWDPQKVENKKKLDKIYLRLSQSANDNVRLYAIRYWMVRHEYAKALDLIDSMEAEGEIGAYLSESRAKALWAMRQLSPSRAALYTFLSAASPQERMDTSSWFCLHESIQGCSPQQEKICQSLQKNLDQFQRAPLDSQFVLAQIHHEECQLGSKTNYREFLKWPLKPSTHKLIEALALQNSHPEKAQNLFIELLNAEPLSSSFDIIEPITHFEAAWRLLNLTTKTSTLSLIYENWSRHSSHFGDHWAVLGQHLFETMFEQKHYLQALETGKKLTRILNSPQFIEKLIVSAQASGHSKYAWDLLSTQTRRAPASLRQYEEVRKTLQKRFGQ